MKTQEYKIFYIIAVAGINTMALALGVLVGLSNIFINSKFGIILFIISAAVAITCYLLNNRDKRTEAQFSQAYSALLNEFNGSKKKIADIEADNEKLKTELAANNNSKLQADYDALKEKCDTVEKFRNSFPLNVAPGFTVYNIIRTALHPGKCSSWKITGTFADELWECDIIRPETQFYTDMLSIISATKTPDEIENLSVGNEMFWK